MKNTDIRRYRRFLCGMLKAHTKELTSAKSCMRYSETELYLVYMNNVAHELQKCNRILALPQPIAGYEKVSTALYEYYVERYVERSKNK